MLIQRGITANIRVLGFDAFSRGIYHLIEVAGRFLLHPRQHMRVDIHCGLGFFVAQAFLHNFDIHALLRHKGGVGMSCIM